MTAGSPAPYTPPEAVKIGWARFSSRPGPFVVLALLAVVVVGLLTVLLSTVTAAWLVSDAAYHVDPETGALSFDPGSGLFATWVVPGAVIALIAGVPAQFLLAGMTRGALDLQAGRSVSVPGMFRGWDRGRMLVAAALVSIAMALGTLLCSVPGIVVAFVTSYTMMFIVDRGLAPVDAIRASIAFTVRNLGPTLLYWLLAAVLVAIGAALCGIGLLVALPVAVLGQVHTYLRLEQRPADDDV